MWRRIIVYARRGRSSFSHFIRENFLYPYNISFQTKNYIRNFSPKPKKLHIHQTQNVKYCTKFSHAFDLARHKHRTQSKTTSKLTYRTHFRPRWRGHIFESARAPVPNQTRPRPEKSPNYTVHRIECNARSYRREASGRRRREKLIFRNGCTCLHGPPLRVCTYGVACHVHECRVLRSSVVSVSETWRIL